MAVNVVSFSFSWCSTGGPGVHSAGCWLSLLHLISIFSGPQLIRALSPFSLVWLSVTLLVFLPSPTVCNSTGPWLPSWLRYIIIERPHDHPLDLWNRMFNRHQAEITVSSSQVTLFRCISLWVYHGNFLARPISSANFRPRDFLS